MANQNTTLKCSWKNGIIWAVITAAAAGGLHWLMWYLTVGGLSQAEAPDEIYYMTQTLLIASFFLPVVAYLIMYKWYMSLAGHNPHQLAAVARNGKPALWMMILLAVLEILWILVTTVVVYVFFQIDMGDMLVIEMYLMASGGCLVVDFVLFLLGKRFFKPDRVQENH